MVVVGVGGSGGLATRGGRTGSMMTSCLGGRCDSTMADFKMFWTLLPSLLGSSGSCASGFLSTKLLSRLNDSSWSSMTGSSFSLLMALREFS